MLNKEIILNFLETHSEYLKNKFHISKIGLIGSFARYEQNDSSDIDFIIEFESGTQNLYDLKIELREYLKSYFHRDIDLCREKYIKPYIKEYLLNEVIYV